MDDLVLVLHGPGATAPRDVLRAADGLCRVAFFDPGRSIQGLERYFHGVPVFATPADVAVVADQISGITTYSDSMIRQAAIMADRLGLGYTSLASAEALTDKAQQRAKVLDAPSADEAGGLLRTMGEAERHFSSDISWPRVLKPLDGTLGRRVIQVQGPVDALEIFKAQFWSMRDACWSEELLDGDSALADQGWGDYVSVETASVGEDHQVLMTLGKPPLWPDFREAGNIFPAPISADLSSECARVAVAGLRAIGASDILSHTELKLTKDGPQIIEINGRLGGGVATVVRLHWEKDAVAWPMEVALGKGPKIEHAREAGALIDDKEVVTGELILHEHEIPGVETVDKAELVRAIRTVSSVRYVRLLGALGPARQGVEEGDHVAEIGLSHTSRDAVLSDFAAVRHAARMTGHSPQRPGPNGV